MENTNEGGAERVIFDLDGHSHACNVYLGSDAGDPVAESCDDWVIDGEDADDIPAAAVTMAKQKAEEQAWES